MPFALMVLSWLSSGLGLLARAAKAFFAWAIKPPGLYVLLALLVLIAVWGSGEIGYRRGHTQGVTDCEAKHTAANVEEIARQQKVGADVTAASEVRTTKDAVQNVTNKEILTDVKARAAALPPVPAVCPPAVPADLADRLRDLE